MKVLYWNVWQVPSIFTDCHGKERANGVNKTIRGYDLVVLNEVFTNKDIITKDLTEYPYSATTPNDLCKLGIGNSGLLILSKYPIIESEFIIYNNKSNYDYFASKGCLKVKINDGQKDYLIYTTHMQAGGRPIDNSVRMKQTEQLIDFIQKTSQNQNYLLIGDFNMCEDLTSVHFTDQRDAKERVETFNKLRDTLQLKVLQTDIIGYLTHGVLVDKYEYNPCDYSDGPYITAQI